MKNQKISLPEQGIFFIEEIEQIARSAGGIIKAHYTQGVIAEFKSLRQVVTTADRESEQFLKEALLQLYPCHFYGEESGGVIIEQGDQWVVDPLDGTENMTGYPPLLAVSIGLLRNGTPVLGVVYDPIHDILYSAQQGGLLKINGEVTQLRKRTDPTNAVVGLDFSSEMQTRPETLDQLSRVLQQARAVKVLGAPVLSLAEVAAGRLDLFFRPSTKLTDMAAGVCMIRAAGGKAVDYEGEEWTIHSKGVIAGSSGMIEAYMPCFYIT
ncbi:inositol monophosphatase family protein [Nitrosospira multiformis]|nr:inositol monophosphatase family protein [Nitrosospira multiformis]